MFNSTILWVEIFLIIIYKPDLGLGGKRYFGEKVVAIVKDFGGRRVKKNCEGTVAGSGRKILSMFRGKRYYRDKNAMSSKDYVGGGGESRIE